MAETPRVNSAGEKELKKVEAQLNQYQEGIDKLVAARSPDAPAQETERQTQLSRQEIKNSTDIYLKPCKTVPDNQKFNEKFRKDWEFQKEYVHFIAEHKECIGETLDFWTHPFGGVGAEEWKVPTNKPVWAPRYVAEQIRSKSYSRLKMEESNLTADDGRASYYGSMVLDTKIKRLDAYPVRDTPSIFGSRGF